jgi:hypothetical protein
VDMNEIYAITNPATHAISDTMKFIRNFKQGQVQGQTGSSNNQSYTTSSGYGSQQQGYNGYPPPYGYGPYPPQMYGYGQQPYGPPPMYPPMPGGTMPSPELMQMYYMQGGGGPAPYNPAGNVMMQQIMMGLFQQMLANGGSLGGAGIQDPQIAMLQNLFPGLADLISAFDNTGSSDNGAVSTQAGRTKALNSIKELLGKQSYENESADTDDDNYITSSGDVETLQSQIEEGDFTTEDLNRAFSYMLVKGSISKQDELVNLLFLSQGEDVIDIRDVLRPKVVEKFTNSRRSQIAQLIADRGLAEPDGTPDSKLVGYLNKYLDADAPDGMRAFARLITKNMATTWIKPEIPTSNADRDLLTDYLRLNGFVFNTDGSLQTDSNQPFPIGVPDPEEADDEDETEAITETSDDEDEETSSTAG